VCEVVASTTGSHTYRLFGLRDGWVRARLLLFSAVTFPHKLVSKLKSWSSSTRTEMPAKQKPKVDQDAKAQLARSLALAAVFSTGLTLCILVANTAAQDAPSQARSDAMLQKILTESLKAASSISDPAERASTYNSIAMCELQQGGWRVSKFPATAQENKTYQIQTLYRQKLFRRKEGEALHPEREPLEVLGQMREIQGEYNFSGQYQQAPSPLGGGIIKTHWLHFYQREETPSDL
jgi:hypothetical protein